MFHRSETYDIFRPFARALGSAAVEPIIIEAVRGDGIVEARHVVHAVAVQDGAVVAEAGDAALTCFLRSSSKPFQALPLVRSRADLEDAEVAIACASHRATDEQLAAVRALLAKAEASEDDLEVGLQPGRPLTRLHHNCSGKHAGMLATCRARGWPTRGYRLPEHPLQQEIAVIHADAAGAAVDELPTATDGCGVVTFALPLERMAYAFSRLEQLEGGARVAAAMRARPDLVGGPDGADDELMRLLPGWLAKGGAEGLLCAAGPGGFAVALKTEDGATRPHRPALAAFLAPLGHELPWESLPVENSRRDVVGSLRVVSAT
jgi:L-asparaginase II